MTQRRMRTGTPILDSQSVTAQAVQRFRQDVKYSQTQKGYESSLQPFPLLAVHWTNLNERSCGTTGEKEKFGFSHHRVEV